MSTIRIKTEKLFNINSISVKGHIHGLIHRIYEVLQDYLENYNYNADKEELKRCFTYLSNLFKKLGLLFKILKHNEGFMRGKMEFFKSRIDQDNLQFSADKLAFMYDRVRNGMKPSIGLEKVTRMNYNYNILVPTVLCKSVKEADNGELNRFMKIMLLREELTSDFELSYDHLVIKSDDFTVKLIPSGSLEKPRWRIIDVNQPNKKYLMRILPTDLSKLQIFLRIFSSYKELKAIHCALEKNHRFSKFLKGSFKDFELDYICKLKIKLINKEIVAFLEYGNQQERLKSKFIEQYECKVQNILKEKDPEIQFDLKNGIFISKQLHLNVDRDIKNDCDSKNCIFFDTIIEVERYMYEKKINIAFYNIFMAPGSKPTVSDGIKYIDSMFIQPKLKLNSKFMIIKDYEDESFQGRNILVRDNLYFTIFKLINLKMEVEIYSGIVCQGRLMNATRFYFFTIADKLILSNIKNEQIALEHTTFIDFVSSNWRFLVSGYHLGLLSANFIISDGKIYIFDRIIVNIRGDIENCIDNEIGRITSAQRERVKNNPNPTEKTHGKLLNKIIVEDIGSSLVINKTYSLLDMKNLKEYFEFEAIKIQFSTMKDIGFTVLNNVIEVSYKDISFTIFYKDGICIRSSHKVFSYIANKDNIRYFKNYYLIATHWLIPDVVTRKSLVFNFQNSQRETFVIKFATPDVYFVKRSCFCARNLKFESANLYYNFINFDDTRIFPSILQVYAKERFKRLVISMTGKFKDLDGFFISEEGLEVIYKQIKMRIVEGKFVVESNKLEDIEKIEYLFNEIKFIHNIIEYIMTREL